MHVLQGGRDTAPTFNLGYIHLNPLNRAEILRRIRDSWTESDPCKSQESDPWLAPTLAGGVLGNYSSPLVGCFHSYQTTSIAAITHCYCYCGMLLFLSWDATIAIVSLLITLHPVQYYCFCCYYYWQSLITLSIIATYRLLFDATIL